MELSDRQVAVFRASVMSLAELAPDVSGVDERSIYNIRKNISNILFSVMVSSLSKNIDEETMDYINAESERLRSRVSNIKLISKYAESVFNTFSNIYQVFDIDDLEIYIFELRSLVVRFYNSGNISRKNIYDSWALGISENAGSFLEPIFNSGKYSQLYTLEYFKKIYNIYFGSDFSITASMLEIYLSCGVGPEYKFSIPKSNLEIERENSDYPSYVLKNAVKIFSSFNEKGEIYSYLKSLERVLVYEAPVSGDAATGEDLLGRRPLARALAGRIKEFYSASRFAVDFTFETGLKSSNGWAINLTAPWGVGKTSFLHMLDRALRQPTDSEDIQSNTDWIVIHFNAWDHERRRPPWWAMIENLYQSGLLQLKRLKSREQSKIDFESCWRRGYMQSDWALYALAGIFPVLFLGIMITIFGNADIGAVVSSASGVSALAATFYLYLRGLIFGGAQNANFHFELKRDPLRHSRRLFEGLITAVQGPVCICIDDLDRCDADYVVDLLEGIQTAFRHPNVVYVVAADRKWIKAAFEHRYSKAFGQVPTLGNPLGYLFVDKIFQDSIILQPPPEAVRVDYWHKVIGQDALAKQASNDARLEELKAQEEAEEAFKVAEDLEGIQAVARQASEDTNRSEIEKRAFRNKAFEAIAQSSEARRVAEHAFKHLHAIIPFNPRALKRLSNTLTLRMAEEVRSGQRVHETTLARWVVLEFSYPELADLLYENPEWASYLIDPKKFTQEEQAKCEALRPYVGEKAIRDIFVKTGEGLGQALSVDDVFIITQGRPREREASQ